MSKRTSGVKKRLHTIRIPEEVISAIDKWVEQKEKETGGKFSRSLFMEKAVMDKIDECGLMNDKVQ